MGTRPKNICIHMLSGPWAQGPNEFIGFRWFFMMSVNVVRCFLYDVGDFKMIWAMFHMIFDVFECAHLYDAECAY